MSDPIEVPAEVLAVFRKIQAVADATVNLLEELQAQPGTLQLSATGSGTTTGSLSVQTIYPIGIASEEDFALPIVALKKPPMPTVPEVKMAHAWVEGSKTALRAAELLIMAEGLLQLADRLLGIHQ
ncbi:hypothetical protein Mame01_65460 [Microbispora amethystogenes]|nr:hypothetical protein Mame01_65460 [Microbispora amethystogenes]